MVDEVKDQYLVKFDELQNERAKALADLA